jgi:hypothetical protein
MSYTSENIAPKPYQLIPFPTKKLDLIPPIGHEKYHNNRLHGTLYLTLTVQTGLHISTGVVAMGSDIGQNRIALIKLMANNAEKKLLIPGSSLKGSIRSVYEAITNSTLAVATNKYKDKIPAERLPCQDKEKLCPASRVFGALNWQGLINFTDAQCTEVGFSSGFMPSLYRPRPDECPAYFNQYKKAIGRKFYYHTIRAASPGESKGVPVQQAAKQLKFTTQLHFKNLTLPELGVLFITFGQDKNYPMALKVGAGKPVGIGTMLVEVTKLDQPNQLRNRYLSYEQTSEPITEKSLQTFMQDAIQAAHKELIEKPQLEALQRVLFYPTNRQPPEGMY